MDLLNGHTAPSPKDLPEPISRCNPMGRCVVLLITHSTHKSAERSEMVLSGCSIQPGLVIVVLVLCARNVKKAAPRSNHDG